jgi:hypothetical protein
LNQSIAAAQPLSSFTNEPPLNPLSVSGQRLPPAEPVVRPVLPAANETLAAPLTGLAKKHKQVNVMLCLMNGERITVESFDDEDAAKERARGLTRELGATSEWQLIGARFVRPDAVVTVDLESAKK